MGSTPQTRLDWAENDMAASGHVVQGPLASLLVAGGVVLLACCGSPPLVTKHLPTAMVEPGASRLAGAAESCAATQGMLPWDSADGFVGVLVGQRSGAIASRVAGVLSRITVVVGQRVKRGDAVAELEAPSGTEESIVASEQLLAMAIAGSNRAAIERQAAGAAAARAERLGELMSQSERETATAKARSAAMAEEEARASVRQREADLARLRRQRADHVIRAETDGTVGAVYAAPGEFIRVGASLLVVLSSELSTVRFVIPSAQIARHAAGDSVEVVDNGCRPLGRAVVTTLSSIAEPETQLIVVDATPSDAFSAPVGTAVKVFARH